MHASKKKCNCTCIRFIDCCWKGQIFFSFSIDKISRCVELYPKLRGINELITNLKSHISEEKKLRWHTIYRILVQFEFCLKKINSFVFFLNNVSVVNVSSQGHFASLPFFVLNLTSAQFT